MGIAGSRPWSDSAQCIGLGLQGTHALNPETCRQAKALAFNLRLHCLDRAGTKESTPNPARGALGIAGINANDSPHMSLGDPLLPLNLLLDAFFAVTCGVDTCEGRLSRQLNPEL